MHASVIAAVVAAIMLGTRNRRYRRIAMRDAVDENADGIPDVYQQEQNPDWFKPSPGSRR